MAEELTLMARVAASTVAAAHRRDHAHDTVEACCHPHKVEVIGLGRQAVVVCHDCCADTGYLEARAAEGVAAAHRRQTSAADVALDSTTAA
jgi:hypothetical protein